jgi:hypothetical protein
MASRLLSALSYSCFGLLAMVPAASYALDYELPYVKQANFYFFDPAASGEFLALSAYLPNLGPLNETYCGQTIRMRVRTGDAVCKRPSACGDNALAPRRLVRADMPEASGQSCRVSNAQGVEELVFEDVEGAYVYMTMVIANRTGSWSSIPTVPGTIFVRLNVGGGSTPVFDEWLTTPDAAFREIPVFDCPPDQAGQVRACNGPF